MNNNNNNNCWTIVAALNEESVQEQSSIKDIQQQLEKGNEQQKIEVMKKILSIMMHGQGEQLPQLLMPIIRFILPSKNKQLKKLLIVYWEYCPKYNTDGKLKQEMILVCNYLLNDLQSPNEYVRSCTLRFLCKVKEVEVLESLLPAIGQCLQHKNAIVRRSAVMCVWAQNQHMPDAVDLIKDLLQIETDENTRMLAVLFLNSLNKSFVSTGYFQQPPQTEELQLTQLITMPTDLKLLVQQLQSSANSTVRYESAKQLLQQTQSAMALKSVAQAYCQLILQSQDYNIKLIVLQELQDLTKRNNVKLFSDLSMDVLRLLSVDDEELVQKSCEFCVDLCQLSQLNDCLQLLINAINSSNTSNSNNNSWKQSIILQTIHQLSMKYPQQSSERVLSVFISQLRNQSDTIGFIKEILINTPPSNCLKQLQLVLKDLSSSKLLRGCCWLISEYSTSEADIIAGINSIIDSIGPLPITSTPVNQPDTPVSSDKVKVLSDGTYVQQHHSTPQPLNNSGSNSSKSMNMRQLLLSGDFYLATVVSSSLTKLILKINNNNNELNAKVLLVLTSCLRLPSIDQDSTDRIMFNLNSIVNSDYSKYISSNVGTASIDNNNSNNNTKNKLISKKIKPVESLIKSKWFHSAQQKEQISDLHLAQVGSSSNTNATMNLLDNIIQLTGFSDKLYAEAIVSVQQYDIYLDLLVVNKSPETLQQVQLDFSTVGDLKIVERCQPKTMAPFSFHQLKSVVKVQSTDNNGLIVGQLIYNQDFYIQLKDIPLDIMDYIRPSSCSDQSFRQMWMEFEWENKILINFNNSNSHFNLSQFLQFICSRTNMKQLNQSFDLQECNFLGANLYAKSIFGEDALANVALELINDTIQGHVRIRSKTQGIALSLGDKISQLK